MLRDILLERLNGGHCALVFDRIDDINDEIAAARAAPGGYAGGEAMDHRGSGMVLSVTAGDPLGLMFRIVVLCGGRRGEVVGFRWAGADL